MAKLKEAVAGNSGPKGDVQQLPEDWARDIETCIPEGERLLGIEDRDNLTSDEVHQQIFAWMHERWQSAQPVDDEEYETVIAPLACVWGAEICQELDWEWGWVKVEGGDGPALVDRDRSTVVYLFQYFRDSIHDKESVPATFALRIMLRDGVWPNAGPGDYFVIG